MTTIAALQCVDKGLIALDDEVATLLPELKDPDILLGFTDNDVPILKKALTPITLR
jgi:CubicO group peptidase (beta-lactamase class C family)